MSLTLKTRIIDGTKPNPGTLEEVKATAGVPDGVAINLMVFEVKFDQKVWYCCWSGGKLVDGQPMFTPIGKAALEALCNLPLGDHNRLTFQELKLGATPLRSKIKKTLKNTPAGSKICFFGDMSGELDGHLPKAFNLIEGTLSVSH